MDDSWTTREILKAAFAADDEFRRRDEEADQRLEQLMQRHQQSLMKRRGGGADLQQNAMVDPPVQQQSTAQQYMDEKSQILWDHWCDRRIENFLRGPFKEPLCEYVSTYVGERVEAAHDLMCEVTGEELGASEARIYKEIAELREQVNGLRIDLQIETKARNEAIERTAEIIDLPLVLRKHNGTDR